MQNGTSLEKHDNEQLIEIPAGTAKLEAILVLPETARGVILFAHGSASGRLSPRNLYLARALHERGFGTLLMDLLMIDEAEDQQKRLDTDLLAERVLLATDWIEENSGLANLRVGYFGADTGAAAVLVAAARAGIQDGIPITGEPGPCAVVCRSGRTDLAGPYLPYVKAPTLLIVGSNDEEARTVNTRAYEGLRCQKELTVIAGASHQFEEAGALDQAAQLAGTWFSRYLERAKNC
ncbi:MAG: dienelactone hydrolase family protein [Blastocatellia bacterium]